MTMQVALLGSNGIVLGSDMKWSVSPPTDGNLMRRGILASKIEISDSGNLAVAFAQSMYAAHRVAKRLIADLDDSDELTRDCRIYNIGRDFAGTENVECILAFLNPVPSLRLFQWFNGGVDLFNSPVLQSTHAGDHHNPAISWLRYYRRNSTESLKFLAAHVVTVAGIINPDGIEGLEIVYSDTAGFHRLSGSENDTLQEQSKAFDTGISRLILGYEERNSL